MKGKVCVITGATSGIGLEAAEQLGRKGARLVLVGRDPRRGDAALARLRAKLPDLEAELRYADLSSLGDIRRLATDLAAALPRIDVLINNAGAFFDRHELTADGLERTFALNHMGYYLLTRLLLEKVKAAAPSRIVVVASDAHRSATLDFSDLAGRRRTDGWTAYRRSKLANILFTLELAEKLAGTGVIANSLHPGFVATRFGDNSRRLGMRLLFGLSKRILAIPPARGAETIVYLAASAEPAASSGGYFAKCRETQPSAAARDRDAARRLWEESARIAVLDP